MTRAIRLTCLSLLLVGLMGSVVFAKPAIAVLGLEVVDKTGTPTPADTVVAQELTSGLRSRAKAGTGPYQLAAGSDKELIDEKLLKNCDDEKPACMSQIGSELGADVMMYGKIEKQGGAYQVTIVLLDVRRKVREKTYPDSIPLSEAQGAALQGWAKKIYAKLTGQTDTCTIAVKTNGGADRGTILVGGQEKGSLTNGVGQVSLSEGRYSIAVEAKDFHRWDKSDVTCTAGQTTSLTADLERSSSGGGGVGPGGTTTGTIDLSHPQPGTEPHASTGPWKAVMIGGLAIATGVFAVGLVYTRRASCLTRDRRPGSSSSAATACRTKTAATLRPPRASARTRRRTARSRTCRGSAR